MLLKTIALVLPLGIDTFAVSAALSLGGLPDRQRTRVALTFAAFEAGMPLVGLAVGRGLGSAIGGAADYVAVAVLIAVAIWMIWGEQDEQDGLELRPGGPGWIALGVSVSLDELAMGFSLGLLRLPLVPVLVLIGVQAFAFSQLGMRVGHRLGSRAREGAERAAAVALVLLAVWLLVVRVAGS